jgi:hypothetical protein
MYFNAAHEAQFIWVERLSVSDIAFWFWEMRLRHSYPSSSLFKIAAII